MVTTERDYVRRTVGENTQEKQADVERERDDDDRVSKSEQRESALGKQVNLSSPVIILLLHSRSATFEGSSSTTTL